MVENEQENTLHIKVPLEVKDHFRSYLDAIKRKLIVGAIIYAAVTAGLIYFFVAFIREQELILNLFLLLPAAVVVGQLLRAHAVCRKYISSLSEVDRNPMLSFRNDSNGYDVVRGESFSHVAWSSLRSVVETPRCFEFHHNKYQSFIIPKRFFDSASKEEFLRQILRSQLGDKAKLIENTQ